MLVVERSGRLLLTLGAEDGFILCLKGRHKAKLNNWTSHGRKWVAGFRNSLSSRPPWYPGCVHDRARTQPREVTFDVSTRQGFYALGQFRFRQQGTPLCGPNKIMIRQLTATTDPSTRNYCLSVSVYFAMPCLSDLGMGLCVPNLPTMAGDNTKT